jgi:molybdopterin molybdotransferase
LPEGADSVVMQEETEPAAEGTIRFTKQPKQGQNVRYSGEDIQQGDVVLRAGDRIGPAALGLAASMGLDRLLVAARPRVALLSTGDELVMPGTVPPAQMPAGAIYNSNRFFLRRLLERAGCEVSDLGNVPDTRDATVQALAEAAAGHDLVLASGGVSVGEEDHLRPAVQALGRLDLWQVAIKPGKPFAYGQIGPTHVMGLPGNPVSSFVTFLVLARPFLLRLQGATELAPPSIRLHADFDWPRPDKRREFLRVRRNAQGGLDLFPNQGSGVLTSVAWADGLVDNPPGQAIARGDAVRFIALADWL